MSFAQATTAVVVDASAAVGLLLGEERWLLIASIWAEEGSILLAPFHFRAEVANALLRSVRLPAADVAIAMERLERTGIESVDRRLTGLLEAIDLADRHTLTVYDALYLQLALDVEGELATLDNDLRRAARAEDLTVAD